jgi:hypothetical protein
MMMTLICSLSFLFGQTASTDELKAPKMSFNYTKKIDAIYFERAASQLIAYILLNDETLWRWHPDLYSEYLLAQWESGDQISIEKKPNHPGFVLTNVTKSDLKPVIVTLANETRNHLLTIEECEDVKGWFLTERIIKLSDGSDWAAPYDFNIFLNKWSAGNKIFISRSSVTDALLVNMDMTWDANQLDARIFISE